MEAPFGQLRQMSSLHQYASRISLIKPAEGDNMYIGIGTIILIIILILLFR
jgi:hypothetical protein